MRVNFTISNTSISLFYAGRMYSIPSSNPGFADLSAHLKLKEHDKRVIEKFVDRPKAIARLTAGLVQIIDSEVYFQGQPIHNALTNKLMTLFNEGFDVSPWVQFMHRIESNPSLEAKTNLFRFLEKFQAPITEDGYFLAFKRVRSDFMDIYSGTFDNSPGKTCEVKRQSVDPDYRNTCSHGLHVAASVYLDNYASASNNKTVVVKVDPADVVAVPPDYGHSKMRVCKYLVLSEVEVGTIKTIETQVVATTKDTPLAKNVDLVDPVAIAKIAAENLAKKLKGEVAAAVKQTKFTAADDTVYDAQGILALFSLLNKSYAELSRKLGVARSTARRWVDTAQTARAAEIKTELESQKPVADGKAAKTSDVFKIGDKTFLGAAEVMKHRGKFVSNQKWADELGVAKSTAARYLAKAKAALGK